MLHVRLSFFVKKHSWCLDLQWKVMSSQPFFLLLLRFKIHSNSVKYWIFRFETNDSKIYAFIVFGWIGSHLQFVWVFICSGMSPRLHRLTSSQYLWCFQHNFEFRRIFRCAFFIQRTEPFVEDWKLSTFICAMVRPSSELFLAWFWRFSALNSHKLPT